MGTLWICKEKRRLYCQINFAAAEETEDGIPLVQLAYYSSVPDKFGREEGFWVRRDSLEEVTFDMIERAFLQLQITY